MTKGKVITYQEVSDYINGESGNGCRLITQESDYKFAKSKISIKCKCGEIFTTTFHMFKRPDKPKKQCNDCGKKLKVTPYENIKEYIELTSESGCKLLTREDDYTSAHFKLKIQCKCGEEFERKFNNFKHSICKACQKCTDKHMKITKRNWSFEEVKSFTEEKTDCKLISNEYTNSENKLAFICKCQNIFNRSWMHFYTKKQRKCPSCSYKGWADKRRKTLKDLQEIIESEDCTLLSEYDNYKNVRSTLLIECPCGEPFSTSLRVFSSKLRPKTRCDYCTGKSKGSLKIREYLKARKVAFIKEYAFSDCRKINVLPFDYAVFNNDRLSFLVEYDGEQHYKAVKYWKGEEGLKERQESDSIKNQYCKDNSIELIRIPYWDYPNIESILDERLGRMLDKQENQLPADLLEWIDYLELQESR